MLFVGFLAPLQLDARGIFFPWQRCGSRRTWSRLTRNNLDMKRDDMDSGIVTLQSCGAGPVLESMLPDTMMDLGTMGVDTSTPVLGQNHSFRPRSSVSPRLFSHDLLTPVPEAPLPPPPISQPGTAFVSQQHANRTADLIDTVTAPIPPGGGRNECRPLGAGGTKSHADRVTITDRGPLRITCTVGGLPTPIPKDCPPGR